MMGPEWIEAWLEPKIVLVLVGAAWTAIIGGIVWGLQLNWNQAKHANEIGGLKKQMNHVESGMIDNSKLNERATIMLNQVQSEINATVRQLERQNSRIQEARERVARVEGTIEGNSA